MCQKSGLNLKLRGEFMVKNTKNGVLETINRVYYNGLTTTSGGNISCMDGNGTIYITPSGVDKGSLTDEDIMTVKADGSVEGKHTPSMELPFHSNIYKCREDIRAVVHAHAPSVVAYATARKIPDSSVAPCYQKMLGEVADSVYDLPGSLALGDIVKAKFDEGYNSVMMHNHGATVGAETLEIAYRKYETLDNLCAALINASILGGVKKCDNHADYSVKIASENIALTDEELAIAEEMAGFIKRSFYQKLMSTSLGTLCVKTDNGDILFNPDSVGRDKIEAKDIAKYSNGKFYNVCDKTADYLQIAVEIFAQIKEAKVCFISMPNATMGFSISHKYFDAKLIPESYIMLKNAVQLECGVSAKQIAANMATTKPLALVNNECVITIGKNLTKAFDRLEVTDYSARSIISACNIAQITPINDEQSAEIDRTFNGW